MSSKYSHISCNYSNGTYKGRINSKNQPHGRGKMKYKDGSVFNGYFCNGRKHGNGSMTYASGNKYTGQFFNDNRQGYGEFHYVSSQECYVGYWKNNVREGRGEYRFKNGSIFRGIFKNDVKHGIGQKVSENIIYTGNWKNDKKNGIFKFRHVPTGKETLAKYVNDKRIKVKHLKRSSSRSPQTENQFKPSNKDSIKSSPVCVKNPNNENSSRRNPESSKFNSLKSRKPCSDSEQENLQKSLKKEDLRKRSLDSFKQEPKNQNTKCHLAAIWEVSENKFSILTDEPKSKIQFFPDRQSGLSRLDEPGFTFLNRRIVPSRTKGKNLIEFSESYLKKSRFQSEAELVKKTREKEETHLKNSDQRLTMDSLGNEMNRTNSLDLQIEGRKNYLK